MIALRATTGTVTFRTATCVAYRTTGTTLELSTSQPVLSTGGIAVLSGRSPRTLEDRATSAYLMAKRCLDVFVSLVALVVLSPLLLLTALLIKLEDSGPVLFRQTRVGKGGRPFDFLKFRSMCTDAEARRQQLKSAFMTDSVRFKLKRDPRITRVGVWIRRFSIDELPQLVNVLRGDMTLVGPRPPLPEEVAEYGPYERRRLEVEQGITCLWQVSGRSLIPFEQQVELDLEYIRNRNLGMDLSLLVRTVPAVLSGRGAY